MAWFCHGVLGLSVCRKRMTFQAVPALLHGEMKPSRAQVCLPSLTGSSFAVGEMLPVGNSSISSFLEANLCQGQGGFGYSTVGAGRALFHSLNTSGFPQCPDLQGQVSCFHLLEVSAPSTEGVPQLSSQGIIAQK